MRTYASCQAVHSGEPVTAGSRAPRNLRDRSTAARRAGIVTDLPLFGVAEVAVSDQASWGQRWACVFDEHAGALLEFGGSMGLPDHLAQRATGRVIAQHVEAFGPGEAAPVTREGADGTDATTATTRKTLLLAMLTEIERVEQLTDQRSRLRTRSRRALAALSLRTGFRSPARGSDDAARHGARVRLG